jgi:hypothetical protein
MRSLIEQAIVSNATLIEQALQSCSDKVNSEILPEIALMKRTRFSQNIQI